MSRSLSDRAGENAWSTLSDDLRVVSALRDTRYLNLDVALSLCDPLSEIWLTEPAWCRPSCEILTSLVMQHMASDVMRNFVLRLSNVALGVYQQLEMCKRDQEEGGGSIIAQERQRQIVDFLLMVALPDERKDKDIVVGGDLMGEIGDVVIEALRTLRADQADRTTRRQEMLHATVGADHVMMEETVDEIPIGILWLEDVAKECNAFVLGDNKGNEGNEGDIETGSSINGDVLGKRKTQQLTPRMLRSLSMTQTPGGMLSSLSLSPSSSSLMTPGGTSVVIAMPVVVADYLLRRLLALVQFDGILNQ